VYFTTRTFYYRVILAVHCLPMADLLVLSLGEWDVPVRNSLEFTQECLLCATGYKLMLSRQCHLNISQYIQIIKNIHHVIENVNVIEYE